MSLEVGFRPADPEDQNFIYDSWLRSYRDGSLHARAMPARIYYNNHKHVIARILDLSSVLICCNPEDPDQIFGYVVYEATKGKVTVFHYLYVKTTYRNLGIANLIFKESLKISEHDKEFPSVCTHETHAWHNKLRDKWDMIFNPYVVGMFYDKIQVC